MILGREQQPRIEVSAREDGSCGIALNKARGQPAMEMVIDGGRMPAIRMFDDRGKLRSAVFVGVGGPQLALFGGNLA